MSSDETESLSDAIAIIGMAGRYPDAPDVDTLWENLRAGEESIHRLTDEQLRGVEYDFERIKDNPNYVRSRGILADADKFDAKFFGYSPREAAVLDPQQRIWLECAWHALEDAGVAPGKYPGSIGVYAGSYVNTYLMYNLCKDRDTIEKLVRFRAVDAFQNIISNDKDYLPTRTSFKFDLKGPSVTVQTACSTSLVAVAQACSALASFEADVCLAGGICITLPQEKGYLYQEGGMNSPDGHCRPYDRQANGTLFSSGVGVVVLKRMPEALEDGDRILAVLRGWAVNNDGANKVSFPAPSVDGQAEVIALAHSAAGVEPETISYVEGHGTATPLGDPIEVAGLTKAFRAGTQAKGFCGLGSVKSNLGHLDAAAGVTGLIKTILALQHAELPATLHYESPNPEIDFESSPFYVVDRLTPWAASADHPRRAGVSSFGVGGTNVHVVLEEAPAPAPLSVPASRRQVLPISAKTPAALEALAANLAHHFQSDPEQSLMAAAQTLQLGRTDFAERRVVVAENAAGAAEALIDTSSPAHFSGSAPESECGVVFLFPGQGAQHVNMGRDLYETEPVFRAEVDRCAEVLNEELDLDIREILYPEPGQEDESTQALRQTGITQPALFVVEYALAKLWMDRGIEPVAMVGHSLGEYVAAVLAGVFELTDGLRVLATRARLMQEMPGGEMRALRLAEADVQRYLGNGVALAACNAPSTCVVSGSKEAIAELERKLDLDGIEPVRLHTSHAFHSPMMEPVLAPFSEFVASVPRHAPTVPIVSTLTGTWMTDQEAQDPAYWSAQLRQPVRFSAAVQTLLADASQVLLEVGPGKNLGTAALQHAVEGQRPTVVSTCGHPTDDTSPATTALLALGRLWASGVPIDWQRLHRDERPCRARLPVYPFESEYYWIDPPPLQAGEPEATASMEVPAPMQSTQTVPPATPAQAGPSRRVQIQERIREIFYELSGIEIGDTDADTSFLEMGMDSLFLTQASAELGNELGEPIKFRQMLEDVDTLDKLTSYYDEKLPPEAFAPVMAAPPPSAPTNDVVATQVPVLAQTALPVAAGGEAPGAVERIVAMQMQLMQQQLAALGGQGPAAATAQLQVVGQSAEAAAEAPVARHQPVTQAHVERAPGADKVDSRKRFGPYAPVERGEGGNLTERQTKHLEDLVERLTARTRKSKEAAERSRGVLADPRSVSGFRSAWKELVYQIVAERSEGSHLWDIDGNEYVDITMGFGVNFLGHSPSYVVDAVKEQLKKGMQIGPQAELAEEVALGISRLTGLERISFCNTGSEAVMAALRMARTVTGRDRVAYFSGDYHGVFDEALARAQIVRGNVQTVPAAPGILQESVNSSLILDYGSEESLRILREQAGDLAAILVEPVQSRNPDNRPVEFLRELREITHESGTALIFDEVITGFRVHPGGAQGYFDIRADLATYGKVIGGGLPIGVVGGVARFMDALDGGAWQYGDDSAPEADMTFFAGTFVRHPLVLAAARSVIAHLDHEGPELQAGINSRTAAFANDLNGFFESVGAPLRIRQWSSWFRFDMPQDIPFAALLGYHLLDKGVYFREPGQNCFLSTVHSDQDIEKVKEAVKESVREMQQAGFLPGRAELVGDAERPLPLTDGQAEIWLVSDMGDEASCAYNEGFHLDLRGELDVPALSAALDHVCARHEALALHFDADGPSQSHGQLTLPPLEVEDLSASSQEERAARLEAIFDEAASTPFDLANGPLIRFRLLRLSNDTHRLVACAHHIIFDGWSCSVLVDEISQLYSSLRRGESVDLSPASSYLDYVESERTRRDGAEGESALRYWARQFEELPPPLDLPTDRPRPRLRTQGGRSLLWRCDQEAYESFKRAVSAQSATLYAGLFAAYNLLLNRLTGQDDLVVGIMVAGQAQTGEEALVGHCVNLLPVRTRIDAKAPWSSLLAQVKSQLLDAYEQQDCAFGKILEQLPVKRDPSRLPLMDVIFNLDRDVPGQGFEGLEATIRENPKTSTHFDMFLNLNEQDGGLEVKLDYLSDLYDEETIRYWLDLYETVLLEVGRDAEQPVEKVELVRGSDRDELLLQRNRTARVVPATTLYEMFELQVERRGDNLALVVPETADGNAEIRLTYAALAERANRLAHHLQAAGAGPGGLVAFCMDRSADMVVTQLGILASGAAYLPVDPALPAERIGYMLEDSGAAWIVTDGSLDESVDTGGAKLIDLQRASSEIAAAPASRPLAGSSSQDLAYVIYTSGSTGRPKGVEIEHASVVNFLTSMADEPGFDSDDALLAVTTVSFDISVLEIFLPLVVGGRLVLASSEDAVDGATLSQLLHAHSITCMQATPVAWRILLESGWSDSNVKALCGGEALPEDLAAQLVGAAGSVWNMYGPTETTIWSACGRIDASTERIDIGRPIANTQLYVLDAQGAPVPIGAVGELCIGGAGVARGYHGRPELTSARFQPNPFVEGRLYRTGDYARPLRNGSIECLGRMDDQVKLHGFRIELGEVEANLAALPEVDRCAASVRDDGQGGRHLCAWYVPTGDEIDSIELRAQLAHSLPGYMIPSYFMALEELPLTQNRKIDRAALPAPDPANRASTAPLTGPRNPLEQKLVSLWADTLGHDRVGVKDDFFDLGGHSLMAARMLSRGRDEFGVDLSLRGFFADATIAGLADYIEAQQYVESGREVELDGDREEIEL